MSSSFAPPASFDSVPTLPPVAPSPPASTAPPASIAAVADEFFPREPESLERAGLSATEVEALCAALRELAK